MQPTSSALCVRLRCAPMSDPKQVRTTGRIDDNRVIQVTLCRENSPGDPTFFRCKKVVGWAGANDDAKEKFTLARGMIILESGIQLWVEEEIAEISSMMFGGH